MRNVLLYIQLSNQDDKKDIHSTENSAVKEKEGQDGARYTRFEMKNLKRLTYLHDISAQRSISHCLGQG